MGVEGKDRAKVLEAGAAALSNQLGLAVLRLRKSFGLSLAELQPSPASQNRSFRRSSATKPIQR